MLKNKVIVNCPKCNSENIYTVFSYQKTKFLGFSCGECKNEFGIKNAIFNEKSLTSLSKSENDLLQNIKKLEYGKIEIKLHNGKIKMIEKTEKIKY